MIRLFKQHYIREQYELDGLWDFEPVNDIKIIPESYNYKLNVPGCWEMHPDFLTYRGMGSYRKLITIDKKCNLKLDFKGISHTGYVYLDGIFLGKHYNAYTPFYVTVKDVQPGIHELIVQVDNTFSEESTLHRPNDYYTYGGLTRTVAMEKVTEVYIDRVKFVTSLQNNIWVADISLYVKSLAQFEIEFDAKIKLAGKELSLEYLKIKPDETLEINKKLMFSDINPWSDINPNLYTIKAELYDKYSEEPFDDLADRVGFRTVNLSGRKLYINNEEIKLKGFNRHEDHPHYGSAIPFSMMLKDLYILKDTGSNAVRTCHYPNDELFLDLCDELGFYVWEENHARGLSLEIMKNPNFTIQCRDCNREMVENHINHPSIVVWGILNECASSQADGRMFYMEQLQQIRDMDTSRPLSYASCEPYMDICLDLVDIVSFNLYSGWYNNKDIKEEYDKFIAWADTAGAAGKPLIISEFGAGAIYGFREPTKVRWSEEKQADILDESLNVYMNRPEICGTFIWQFCDCRVTEEGTWYLTRPRNKNNKGIMDEYRRPKLSYSVVQKHFK